MDLSLQSSIHEFIFFCFFTPSLSACVCLPVLRANSLAHALRFEMGNLCAANSLIPINMLVIGLDGSGKTTLLYKMRLKKANPSFEPTVAFNYEVISQKYRTSTFSISTWDLSGGTELRAVWPYFYDGGQGHRLRHVYVCCRAPNWPICAANYRAIGQSVGVIVVITMSL